MSNKERGLEREPEPKIGEAANALLRRGEPSRRGELVQEVRHKNTMRENMARQRSEKIEREKQEAIARALAAAERERQRQEKENVLKSAAQAHDPPAVSSAPHPSPLMPDSTRKVAQLSARDGVKHNFQEQAEPPPLPTLQWFEDEEPEYERKPGHRLG